jgi:protocatechuate 3,4-dioxygenase beta subunit
MTVSSRNLLLIAAALGLPLVVWVVLARYSGDPPPAVLAAGGAEGGSDTLDGIGPGDRSLRGEQGAGDDAADASARRGIDALPMPTGAAETVDGEIADASQLVGRVLTRLGAAVADARVILRESEFWLALPADIEVADTQWAQALLGETVTDAEGRFAFEDIEPGLLAIGVLAAGFAPLSRADLRVPEHEHFDMGTLSVERGVRLVGKVVDAKGLGVGGVQILRAIMPAAGSARLELPGFGAPLAMSEDDGAFRVETLAPGNWQLIFDSPDHRVVEERGNTAPAGTTHTNLVVHLDEGLAITGRLEGLDPSSVGGVRITARRSKDQPMADADLIVGVERHRPRYTLVDGAGAFRIAGLAPGMQYLLTATRRADHDSDREWRRLRGVERVHALPGPRRVVMRYEPSSTVRLRVVDSAGLPLTRFVARVGGRGVSGDGVLEDEDGEAVEEHADGLVVFDQLQVKGEGSRVTMSVHAPGFGDWSVEDVLVRPGEDHDLGEAILEPASEFVITVVDDALGSALPGARVVVASVADGQNLEYLLRRDDDPTPFGGEGVRWAHSGDDGVARVTVPFTVPFTGACLVGASAEGYLDSDPVRATVPPAGASTPVGKELTGLGDVGSGAVELRLSRAARVIVALVDPDGVGIQGMAVRHVAGEAYRNRGFLGSRSGPPKDTTDERGEVVFEELAPGPHTFTAMDAASSGNDPFGWSTDSDWEPDPDTERRVELSSGDDLRITLNLPRRGSLRGVVLERGEPLAGARAQLLGIDEQGKSYFLARMGSLSESPTVRHSTHEGRVVFEGFPAGRYGLVVSHPDRQMPLRFDVELAENTRERRFELGLATIEGLVVGEDGLPLADLRVRVSMVDEMGRTSSGDFKMTLTEEEDGDSDYDYESVTADRTRTGPDGRYVLRGVAPDEPLLLQVWGDLVIVGRRELAPLQRDETTPHEDFTLTAAGCLRIRLAGGASGDRTRYTVKLVHTRGKPASVRLRRGQTRTENSLLPGEWVLKVYKRGSEQPLATLQARVVAGVTRDAVLRLP